jgi:hypothetical protein
VRRWPFSWAKYCFLPRRKSGIVKTVLFMAPLYFPHRRKTETLRPGADLEAEVLNLYAERISNIQSKNISHLLKILHSHSRDHSF